jgi:hypothetical protein
VRRKARSRRGWLPVAAGTIGVAAVFGGCNSSPASTTEGPGRGEAYVVVESNDSLPVTVTIPLQPPVQQHLLIQTCYRLFVGVPANDTLRAVITDSAGSFEVPLYVGAMWEIVISAAGLPSILPSGSTNCPT